MISDGKLVMLAIVLFLAIWSASLGYELRQAKKTIEDIRHTSALCSEPRDWRVKSGYSSNYLDCDQQCDQQCVNISPGLKDLNK